jgi:hypothetical protein
MASPLQQQARVRKLAYGVAILVLFTAAWAWRTYSVNAQAHDLALLEEQRGEVELLGSVVRLSLTGSRGLATCYLWVELKDRQVRNEWNEVEVLARSLTKLQPHFVSPWLFQSWNLAYNVSVEADRVADKYFYISRGIDLAAAGERQNGHHPDLRWSVGWYLQHKICQSDETNTLRSLLQLSCIPPNERDPARFWLVSDGRQELNLEEFGKFCRDHPQLVRRLKEGMRREYLRDQRLQFTVQSPRELVQFLADNRRVPSLFEDVPGAAPGAWQERPRVLRPEYERFPLLPPPMDDKRQWTRETPLELRDGVLTAGQDLLDRHDGYSIARSWYVFALEPLPESEWFHDLDLPVPGSWQPIRDRTRERRPKYMTIIIFRDYPSKAQSMAAERLEQEGWFEFEDRGGWDASDWIEETAFKPAGDRDAWRQKLRSWEQEFKRLGGDEKWARDAWTQAQRYWKEHGERNGLKFRSEIEEERTAQLAQAFDRKFNCFRGVIPQVREETLSDEDRRGFHAHMFFFEYDRNRHMTNYPHHYTTATVEMRPETVRARKLFFDAETLRLAASPLRALKKYEEPEALAGWRDKVLLANKDYRRDLFNQEYTFVVQVKYLALLNDLHGRAFDRQAAQVVLMPWAPPGAGAVPVNLLGWLEKRTDQPTGGRGKAASGAGVQHVLQHTGTNPLFGGPFDVNDDEGHPLIEQEVRERVMQRRYPGLQGKPPAGPPPAGPTGQPAQPAAAAPAPGRPGASQ